VLYVRRYKVVPYQNLEFPIPIIRFFTKEKCGRLVKVEVSNEIDVCGSLSWICWIGWKLKAVTLADLE